MSAALQVPGPGPESFRFRMPSLLPRVPCQGLNLATIRLKPSRLPARRKMSTVAQSVTGTNPSMYG